jgi:branched-chain amino acid transport system substrate-binding protein
VEVVVGRWLAGVTVSAAAALLVAGCTDDGISGPTLPNVTVTSTTQAPRPDDGVLRVGILLPESGEGAALGKPLLDAALAARDQINAAGGVLGKDVDVVAHVDEGSSATTARQAIATLIERDVDAVIGPASSTIALATLSQLMQADVLTCSPTATALALDHFPDRELFFRTAPSDSLQASAIAAQAESTGARTAAVAYLDDAYGRPLAEATIAALRARNLAVEDPVGITADNDVLDAQATAIAGSDAGVVIILGDAAQTARMLAALGDVGPGRDSPPIIVNDALRRPPSQQLITSLAPSVRARVSGVSPLASMGSPGEPPGAYAVNAFDCMNLIALATVQAGRDDPRAIAAQISEVSDGGVPCATFAECITLVDEQLNVDYNGPDGVVQIGADGDPMRARFDRWRFDDQGNDVPSALGPMIAGP